MLTMMETINDGDFIVILILDCAIQKNRVSEELSRLKSVWGILLFPFCPMTSRLQASADEPSVPFSPDLRRCLGAPGS